jgi:hypothetical protein
MHVCMYKCMYVLMHICIYIICMYAFMHYMSRSMLTRVLSIRDSGNTLSSFLCKETGWFTAILMITEGHETAFNGC